MKLIWILTGTVALAALGIWWHRGQYRASESVKHSIPLEEIVSGGPPKDGIPPIDHPEFVKAGESDYLDDEDPGIGLSYRSADRFYPFKILVWHEIVNDTIAGERVLVTYCPLCMTAIVFDPKVGGERVEFGTSGKLWQSNLLMYDRKTDSLWSQVLGEAVVGPETGTKLAVIPADLVRFGAWKRAHPGGEVLSKNTGKTRPYGTDPYGDYYASASVYFPVKNQDPRLSPKELILGIVQRGKAKAYAMRSVRVAGEIKETFAGVPIVVKYEREEDVVRAYEETPRGLRRVDAISAFWFSWVAAHPNTELYR